MEGIMVAFKIWGFLSAEQTMHCKHKHCHNLKVETAAEVMGEMEKNQFSLQMIKVLQEACKKYKIR